MPLACRFRLSLRLNAICTSWAGSMVVGRDLSLCSSVPSYAEYPPETSLDSGELPWEESIDSLCTADRRLSTWSPPSTTLLLPSCFLELSSLLLGVTWPRTLSLRKPPELRTFRRFSPPPARSSPSILRPALSGVRNFSFSLSAFSLHLSVLARLSACELLSPLRSPLLRPRKLTSAAGDGRGSDAIELRLASLVMASCCGLRWWSWGGGAHRSILWLVTRSSDGRCVSPTIDYHPGSCDVKVEELEVREETVRVPYTQAPCDLS